MMFPNPRRRSRLTGVAAAALVAVLGLSACTTAAPSEDATAGDFVAADFTVAIAQPPRSIDPALASPPIVVWPAYEPLIYRENDGSLVPSLAESWKYLDESNQEFELTIREGVTFSDGDELTAESVKASLDRFMNTEGADVRYAAGIESIEVTGDRTVVISYADPNPAAAVSLTQDYKFGLIVSPTGLANEDALASETHGTGQYILVGEETVDGSSYVFEPNPTYWNPDAVKFTKVTFNVLPDTASQLAALQSGQADVAWNTSADNVQTGIDAGFQYFTAGGTTQLLMLEGRDQAPLDDPLVREAFAYSIDREGIAAAVYSGLAQPAYSIVLPGATGDSGATIEYDPERSRDLLAEAGYPDGISVQLLASGGWDPNYILSSALQQQLAEGGITVELATVGMGLGDFLTPLNDLTYPMAQFGFSAGADTYFQLISNAYLPGTLGNVLGETDENVSDLLAQAASAQGEEYEDLMVEVVTAYEDLYWVIPIVVSNGHYLIAANIGNLADSSVQQQPSPFAPTAATSWQFDS